MSMSDIGDRRVGASQDPDEAPDAGRDDRTRARLTAAMARAKSASERHVAVAVPLRAAERNRRVAASVLAGGLAYRLFLWLLPFGLIVGGALGFLDADSTEKAVEDGWPSRGDQRRDRRRLACRPLRLVVAPRSRRVAPPLGGLHGREGREARPLARLGRAPLEDAGRSWHHSPSPGCCARSGPMSRSPGGSVTRRGRASSLGVLTVAPLAGLWLWVSLHLPHRDAPWQALLPGALVVAIGFQVLHEVVVTFLVPEAREVNVAVRQPRRRDDDHLLRLPRRDARRRLAHPQQLAPRRAS